MDDDFEDVRFTQSAYDLLKNLLASRYHRLDTALDELTVADAGSEEELDDQNALMIGEQWYVKELVDRLDTENVGSFKALVRLMTEIVETDELHFRNEDYDEDQVGVARLGAAQGYLFAIDSAQGLAAWIEQGGDPTADYLN